MSLNSYIAEQFSKPVGLGGRLVTHIMNRQNRPMYESTLLMLKPLDSDYILDIGCGNGYVLNMLARRTHSLLAGIDISESILKVAKTRNRGFVRNGRIMFSCQNAIGTSFADAVFDKAYTINTVYFWSDLDATMLEIRRVLKPKGMFINVFYSNETLARLSHTKSKYKRFSLNQLTDSAEAAGFETHIVSILNGTAYCVVCLVK